MASTTAAPPTPIRKKRNYKALALNVDTPPAPPPVDPVPPPHQLSSSTIPQQSSSLRQAPLPAPNAPLPAVPGQTMGGGAGPIMGGGVGPPPPPGERKKRPPPMLTLKAPKVSSATGKVSNTSTPVDSPASYRGASPGGLNLLATNRAAPAAPGRQHHNRTDSASSRRDNRDSPMPSSNRDSLMPSNRDSFVPNAKRNTYVTTLSNKLASLDMKDEINFELRNEDLRDLKELGAGNGGSVKMVEHVPSGTIMAKKIVLIDAKPAIRKQILRELQILHDCRSPYIISFFGAFIADPNICICMEFADKGSLDGVYKKIGPVDREVVGRVALCVLEGLTYLYDVHRIIHRDIKPCNILLFSTGKIKICDFGVSGELINSIADTFVGTSTYMSPERIQGAAYTVKSDVWSLGISLIELALGRFPFSESDDLSDDSLDDDDDFSDIHEMEMQRLREEEEDEERRAAWTQAQKQKQNQFAEDFERTLSPARPGPGPLPSMTPEQSQAREEQRAKLERDREERRRVRMEERKKRNMQSDKEKKKEKRKSKGVSLQGGGMTMSILELLQHIVNEPAPRLSWGSGGGGEEREEFPEDAVSFVDSCLLKDPDARLTPGELLTLPWMDQIRESTFDLEAWANSF